MAELVQANWVLLVIALVIGILVAWWIFAKSRRTRVELTDEDEAPTRTRRNQALIDAPPAAVPPAERNEAAQSVGEAERVMPPAAPMGLAGTGVAVEAAARAAPVPEDDRAQADEADRPTVLLDSEPAPVEEAALSPSASPPQQEPFATNATDDLSRIKGLGPKLQAQLRELGVSSVAQIAAWDDAEIDRIDARLGRFQGRIRRDNWPEQARLLVAGDMAAYEERFGKM